MYSNFKSLFWNLIDKVFTMLAAARFEMAHGMVTATTRAASFSSRIQPPALLEFKFTTVYKLCMEISANIVHLWDSCRNKRDQICPKITKKRALLKTHLCDSNQSLIFLVLPRKFYGEGSLWPGRSCRSYDIDCKYLNPHIFFVFSFV